MSYTFASGLVVVTFLGLAFGFGQDAPPVSFAPPVETIIEDEEVIALQGCEEIGVEPGEPVESPIDGIEPIEPIEPITSGSTSGNG